MKSILKFPTVLACISMLVVLMSCSDDDARKIRPDVAKWKKIEVDDKGPIYAIHGGIDDVLLVSIYDRIWRSTDGGENWTKVFNTTDVVGDFKLVGNKLFAISNDIDYFSEDNGLTWTELDENIPLEHQDLFEDLNGVQYRIVSFFEGELALPGEIEKSMNGGDSWSSIYPYKHSIYSMSLDAQNRLYVGTCTQFEWNEEEGWFTENFEVNAAFYYSVSDLGEAYK